MEDCERELQCKSFAYGNTKLANGLITREAIGTAADRIRREQRKLKMYNSVKMVIVYLIAMAAWLTFCVAIFMLFGCGSVPYPTCGVVGLQTCIDSNSDGAPDTVAVCNGRFYSPLMDCQVQTDANGEGIAMVCVDAVTGANCVEKDGEQ